MQTNTTDQFQVEHIEYVSDQPFDEVVAALEKATGDVTDGKYASEVAAAKTRRTSRSGPGVSKPIAASCASSPSTTATS